MNCSPWTTKPKRCSRSLWLRSWSGIPDRAESVRQHDKVVDQHCATVIARMTDYVASHSADVPAGLRVMWAANDLERIADHATNVAEEVIFMVRGQDVRHGLAERE